ncbi:MAG: response regulator [Sphingomonadales bacterium]|nr:MAG: response regulator [Sphingomonadales bacterium]
MASSSASPQGEHNPQGPATILVVEDEFLVRMLICDELRYVPYTVIEAVTADEAVEFLKSGVQVDLILSDVRMPGSLDGLGLLAFVQANYPDVPVIITSGHLDAGAALAEGAAQFLPKPYLFPRALDAVASALGKAE